MRQEIISIGKTVEAAVERGAKQLGLDASDVKYEVIAEAKKGFLGIGEAPAKVKIIIQSDPSDLAYDFICKLIDNMGIDAKATLSQDKSEEGTASIKIEGNDAGTLIGYHGDTLDALQYLANLAANKKSGEDDDRDYTRVRIDIEDYREKREDTLRALARRMASRVLKYKKPITLEPMPPHERRIIHSEVQAIEGVTTFSVGEDSARKVVIALDDGTNEVPAAKKPHRRRH